MVDNQFTTTLRSLSEQYGIPTPESTPRFKSLLQDVFVDNPREMNLLITGLDDDIPGQLQAKKGTVPFEILSGQMIDRLYNTRGMDRQAAEWVVRTWAGALGYDVPTQGNESKTKINGDTVSTPSNKKKKKLTGQQGERVYFPDIPDTGQKEISSKNASEKKESYTRVSEPEKSTSPLMILGIIGVLGIITILFFAMAGGFSSSGTMITPSSGQDSSFDSPERIPTEKNKAGSTNFIAHTTATSDLVQELINQGIELDDNDRQEEAIFAFEQALKIDPDNYWAWIWKAESLENLDRYEESFLAYDKALTINPEDFPNWGYSGRASALYNLKRYADAIDAYDQYINNIGDGKIERVWKGHCLYKLGRYSDAISEYDQALKFDPEYSTPWKWKGYALDKLGRYEDAIEAYDKVIEIDPDDATAWNNKGLALRRLGQYEDAIDAYDHALKINPGYTTAKENREKALSYL
ncbi:Tetratricopeptide repeat protein [anaerobic digester metagenome]